MPTIQFVSKNGKDTAFLPRQHTDDLSLLYRTLDQELSVQNYQRISFFEITDNMVSCEVLKKTTSTVTPHEAIDLPFENDPSVIGNGKQSESLQPKKIFCKISSPCKMMTLLPGKSTSFQMVSVTGATAGPKECC